MAKQVGGLLVVDLGAGWIATVDAQRESVLLQHTAILDTVTGQMLDAAQCSEEQRRAIDADPQRYLARAIVLRSDGSAWSDPHAISPGGLLDAPYCAIMPFAATAVTVLQQKQRNPAPQALGLPERL